MGRTDTSPSVRTLQRFLAVRDHESLLDSLSDPSIESMARHNDYVRALVGEGLCILLNDARCQLPWPVGVNYPGRWKRGMMGLAFRL